MAISITTAEVKRKAGIDSAVTTFDTAIGALISEMQGPIEYSIADIYLADTHNQPLQATLKLGMLVIITGVCIQQLRRETGATEQFTIAGVTIGPPADGGADLIRQGGARLAPYLKSALPMDYETHCISSTIDSKLFFGCKEEV